MQGVEICRQTDCFLWNLKEAKAQLALGTVSLVLLDINLPDGSGLGLLRFIKANNPILPVILLTANDTDRDIVDGLEQGADDYITKPFSLAVLQARVNTQLRKSKEVLSFGLLCRLEYSMSLRDCIDIEAGLLIDYMEVVHHKRRMH